VLALPVVVLIGFAFAAVGTACTTFMRSWQDFSYITLVQMPLFLFSATFFPITAYPEPLRTIVELTPLYRGVDLIRRITTDTLSPSVIVDVVYLAIMGVVFLSLASRRMGKLLTK
jgi:lipooligosaccharide transport system permease protein